MPYEKTILCLANSRRPPSGRCIAGKELIRGGYGSWIRPISVRPSEEISEEERRYEDGADPAVLDIIKVQMIEPKPKSYQSENHLIDDQYYWEKLRRGSWEDAIDALDQIQGPLWVNSASSWHGLYDKISEGTANDLESSLCLIRPENVEIIVGREGGDFGPPRRRVRARFNLNDFRYNFVVTDPIVERQYFAQPDGIYPIEDAIFCLSLSAPYHGFAFKLVAAMITPD